MPWDNIVKFPKIVPAGGVVTVAWAVSPIDSKARSQKPSRQSVALEICSNLPGRDDSRDNAHDSTAR
jgi:hypothetical protein